MRYVLIMCDPEAVLTGPAELREDPVHERWIADVQRRGVLVGGEQLRPVVDATTVSVRNRQTLVTDGPFAETKELVAGFWILQVKSKEEAIEWIRRAPFDGGAEVEIRQVFETEDFEELTPEMREAEERMRAQVEEQAKGQ